MTRNECEKSISEICEMCFKKHELEYGHQPINCAFREFDNEDCPTVKVLNLLIQEHFDGKSETNYEHFKDEIVQSVKYNLAVVNGEAKLCGDINCDECDFKDSGECVKRVREWLNQQYKEPKFKLTQFEYDLLEQFLTSYKLKEITMIMKLKTKGYFNNINFDLTVGEVLDNCEVSKMEKRKRND